MIDAERIRKELHTAQELLRPEYGLSDADDQFIAGVYRTLEWITGASDFSPTDFVLKIKSRT